MPPDVWRSVQYVARDRLSPDARSFYDVAPQPSPCYPPRMPDRPPPDPADHAEDFAHRYFNVLDHLTGEGMAELGFSPRMV